MTKFLSHPANSGENFENECQERITAQKLITQFWGCYNMARGDDLHAIKYLPLKLKGPARYWLNSLPENSIGSWEDLEEAFLDNFRGTYVRPPDADDLSHIVQ